jgi:hypothetical protein
MGTEEEREMFVGTAAIGCPAPQERQNADDIDWYSMV